MTAQYRGSDWQGSLKSLSHSRSLQAGLGIVVALLLIRLWPHKPLSQRVPLSTAVWSADGELLRFTLASDDQYRLWTPLKEMPPELAEAFLLKEDRWFYWHPGVNPVALARAGFRTAVGGSRQGGSTLTMQLGAAAVSAQDSDTGRQGPPGCRSDCGWRRGIRRRICWRRT